MKTIKIVLHINNTDEILNLHSIEIPMHHEECPENSGQFREIMFRREYDRLRNIENPEGEHQWWVLLEDNHDLFLVMFPDDHRYDNVDYQMEGQYYQDEGEYNFQEEEFVGWEDTLKILRTKDIERR